MKIQEMRTGASSRWIDNDEMKRDESNWNCRIFSCLENRPMSAAGIEHRALSFILVSIADDRNRDV